MTHREDVFNAITTIIQILIIGAVIGALFTECRFTEYHKEINKVMLEKCP